MTNKTIAHGNVVLKMKGDGIVAEANRIKNEMRQIRTTIKQATPDVTKYANETKALAEAFRRGDINGRQFSQSQDYLRNKYGVFTESQLAAKATAEKLAAAQASLQNKIEEQRLSVERLNAAWAKAGSATGISQVTKQAKSFEDAWKKASSSVGVTQLTKQAKSFEDAWKKATSSIGVTQMTKQARALEDAWSKAASVIGKVKPIPLNTNEVSMFASSWDRAALSIGKYVAAGYLFNKTKGLISDSVSLAGQVENASIELEVLVGEKKKSQELLASMRQLANTSPLTFSGVSSAARTMLSFGVDVEKIMPTLVRLGNITRADDDRLKSLALAFSQASAASRLQGQDLLQMVNAGFNPLLEISQRTGVSMLELRKQMEDGKISTNLMEMAFKTATDEGGRFNGMLEKQKSTLQGAQQELKANIEVLKTGFGEELLPIIKEITKELTQITKKGTQGDEGWMRKYIDGAKLAGMAAIDAWDFFTEQEFAFEDPKWIRAKRELFRQSIEQVMSQVGGPKSASELDDPSNFVMSHEMKAEMDRIKKEADALKEAEESDKKTKKDIEREAKNLVDIQKREIESAQKKLEIELYGKAIAERNEAIRKGVSKEIAKQIEQMVLQTEELDKQQKMAEKFKRETESAKKKAEELARDSFESMVNKIQDLQKLLNVNAIDKNTFDKAAMALGADYQKEIKGDADGLAKTASFGSSEAYKLLVGGKSKQEQQLDRSIAVQQAILEVQRRTEGHLRNQTSLRAYR